MRAIARQHEESVWPGLGFVAVGVGLAFAASRFLPVSVLMLALVLGVIAANTGMIGSSLNRGLSFAARQLLRAGIVLLGLQLAVPQVLELGWGLLLMVAVTVIVTFIGTVAIGRALGLSRSRCLIIATGFSICGASAVAAAASVVRGDDDDVPAAIALVTVYGSAAIIILPALYGPSGLDAETFGIWAGASVHEVAQVIAVSGAVATSAVAPAVLVKLTRVVMLAPVIAVMSVLERRAATSGSDGAEGGRPPIVPVFVVGFLAAMALRSTGFVPPPVLEVASMAQTALLAAAMFGLGTAVRPAALLRGGGRGLLLGLLSSLVISAVSYAGLMLL